MIRDASVDVTTDNCTAGCNAICTQARIEPGAVA